MIFNDFERISFLLSNNAMSQKSAPREYFRNKNSGGSQKPQTWRLRAAACNLRALQATLLYTKVQTSVLHST